MLIRGVLSTGCGYGLGMVRGGRQLALVGMDVQLEVHKTSFALRCKELFLCRLRQTPDVLFSSHPQPAHSRNWAERQLDGELVRLVGSRVHCTRPFVDVADELEE